MQSLRLAALDEEDLAIVSAHAQDAVLKVSDLNWHSAQRRLTLALNRFVWEKKRRWFRQEHERRRAVLSFDRILSLRSSGIDRNRPDDILSLLAIRFEAGEAPSGIVELIFSGGGAVRLEVECIEARLADVGGAWEARGMPRHD